MFLTQLIVQEVRGRNRWRLHEDLVYRGNVDEFVVPRGFQTDFASVPRAFWGVYPPYGTHTKAAVVHDYLYREQPIVRGGKPISRKDADGIFERIMRELGTSWWRRKTMHLAVRLFGGRGYRKWKKK